MNPARMYLLLTANDKPKEEKKQSLHEYLMGDNNGNTYR